LKVVKKCVAANRDDIKKLRDHNNMLNVTVEEEKDVYQKLKSMDMVQEGIWNAKFKTDTDPTPDTVPISQFWNAVGVHGDPDLQRKWKQVLHIPQDSTVVKKTDVLGFSAEAVESVQDASHKIKGGRFERMKMYREKVKTLKEGENLRPPVPCSRSCTRLGRNCGRTEPCSIHIAAWSQRSPIRRSGNLQLRHRPGSRSCV
jgi:hypothetical protein